MKKQIVLERCDGRTKLIEQPNRTTLILTTFTSGERKSTILGALNIAEIVNALKIMNWRVVKEVLN